MKFSFEFSNLCGSSFKQGNVVFSKDGNCVLSPVGNRVSIFDLVNHKCSTFPFEHQNNIARIALSPNGQTLISVDVDGRAILSSYNKRVELNRFTFKEPIADIKYSPDSKYIAVTKGKHLQIWVSPIIPSQFAPFTLYRTYAGHCDEITHISWSHDSQFIFTCSSDNAVKMFSLDPIDGFHPLTLNGHRSTTVASFLDLQDNLYTISKDGALFVWSRRSESDAELTPASGRRFSLQQKHFFNKDHAKVECAAFHHCNDLNFVAVGFSSGVFSLYELPSFQEIHSLSISQHHITSVAINPTGEWLAFGSDALGQLLVWEWQSETYILKQQGHNNDVTVVAYSPDGQLMATGGEDGKVKIWNSTTGFCFATFADHTGPVSAIEFTSSGNVVVSASLDGTVRAFDLIRYRNFRTLVTPTTCQFLSLAIDPSGEIICAGSMDPFDIFVWSLQTGRLLDVLSGHEGPVCSLAFSPENSYLASGSWDKTARVWDVFEHKATIDTLRHNSDVLAIAFRSDGNELCTSSLDGQLYFWDVNESVLKGTIECKQDIKGGRQRATPRSTEGIAFTTISYSADGKAVLAGGDSNNICLYDVEQRSLLRTFKISSNRSLDGVVDQLNSKRMTDSGNLDDINVSDSEDDDLKIRLEKRNDLPGVHRGDYSSRSVPRSVRCRSLRFSPTGRAWAAAATEGLLIYSLDQELVFDPVDLDIEITPATILSTLKHGEYAKALLMALRLNEAVPLQTIIIRTPVDDISLVVRSIPLNFLERMVNLISDGIEHRQELEIHLLWAVQLLMQHDHYFKRHSNQLLSSFRSLQKNLVKVHRNLSSMCDSNKYQLQFLISRCQRRREMELDEADEIRPAA